mgnify:CR=1 FL=1
MIDANVCPIAGAKPGRHLHERSVQKVFDRAYKKANINEHVSMHTLRHSVEGLVWPGQTEIRCIFQYLRANHKHLHKTEANEA